MTASAMTLLIDIHANGFTETDYTLHQRKEMFVL